MSYIPPLVCDTPPPIDFEDSHEDDFGDGMFSNYDGSSLPTTPKQLSSVNDHDDLPLDIPELPDVPHFPHTLENELAKNQNLKNSSECTDFHPANVSTSQSNHIYDENESPQPPPFISNSTIEKDSDDIPKTVQVETVEQSIKSDVCSDPQVNDPHKIGIPKHQSLEGSSNSQFNSNDIVYRSESPPSLVFSAESINCDDNQSDFEEFQQNTDDVECNFPSLKLDSISDTKSQSSDLDETNNLAESEIADIKDNCVTINATNDSHVEVELDKNVDTESGNVECNVTVTNTDVDDSFDDFIEYESNVEEPEKCGDAEYQAAVAEKIVFDESTQSVEIKDENGFAADFSQFEVFSENTTNEPIHQHDSDTTLDQHPNPSEQQSTVTDVKDDFENVDDDDEFGDFNDFNDFSQSQTFATPLTTNVDELSAKIKPLLDSLFPSSDNDSDDGSYDALSLTNDTTRIIKDFENSKALDHQWTTSVGKSSLVTALGIDSRNILHGGKWNSSMPRFAANLGFSPLEPIKPTSVTGTTSCGNSSASNEIPAAQFDWNSSGLTNPLDGVQEILHKTNVAENQPTRTELDWHSTKTEPTLIAQTAPAGNIQTTLKTINATNFIVSEESTQTSASYVVPGSGTLKETHIFTPSKSPNSIPQSRDVQSDKPEMTKCPDFDYEKAAAGIIINENVVKKEYRDIEYDPDKPTASALSGNDDFSDFQSVPIPVTVQNPHKPHQNMLSMDFGILQPTKPNDNITINWPDPGNVVTTTNLESFESFKSVEQVVSGSPTNERSNSTSSSFGDFARPVIGVSPSEVMFEKNSATVEDEFSDFQSVEPIPAHNKFADTISTYQSPSASDVTPSNKIEPSSKNISDNNPTILPSESNSSNLKYWTELDFPKVADTPITTNVPSTNILQPAPLQPLQMLTPQPVNPPQPSLHTNTIWPESEIDPDEIARLEAIFPQAQKQSLPTKFDTKSQHPKVSKHQEDDEWSDFVSVPTAATQSLPITNIISANIVKHQQDDDEWSDFVSSTTQPSINQQWKVNSGPNFTSWNAPPQFDSWQSSTLFQQHQQFVAPPLPVTVNNNPTLITNQTAKTNPTSFFTQKAPNISLIPDLSFVAPKTLVNRSRTNYQSK